MGKINEEVNGKNISYDAEKNVEDTWRIITKTAKFSINEEAVLRKKMNTYSKEVLVLKLEIGNNPRIFCSSKAFEWVKRIIKTQLPKAIT